MAQSQEVIARARAPQGLVRAEAPRTESHRTLTAPVVQALLDAELFYLMVPAALGGSRSTAAPIWRWSKPSRQRTARPGGAS
jgi:hypothetical protein